MVTTPTVLVLGAGASYPYGFPTARELKASICEAFSNPSATGSRFLGDNSDYSGDEFFQFREAFLKSGQPSIDAFLEHRPDFLGVGKLAIAYCLIPFEDEAMLYKSPGGPGGLRGGDWYEHLSVKLTTSFEEFGKNQLSIITFNYDRSLEHYLLTALQNLHGKTLEECAKALAQIPIIHVYGQLGKIPYPQQGSHPYRPDRDLFEHISEAASGITLLHEHTSELEEAHRLLKGAERICFLGFSFHPLNVSRLRIDTTNLRPKGIFGTTRGLIGGELITVEQSIGLALGNAVSLYNADSLELLRSAQILR